MPNVLAGIQGLWTSSFVLLKTSLKSVEFPDYLKAMVSAKAI